MGVPLKLMGVDVGFSATRPTTGIACLDGNELHIAKTGSQWESRASRIPRGFQPTVIAFDGPLLPQGADKLVPRLCESAFIRAPFHNRCKPGLSHWGRGLELRRASAEACAQFTRTLSFPTAETDEHSVCRHGHVVEAFPNAFLGVLMQDKEFRSAPTLKRGQRFDWLYDRVVNTGCLEATLSRSLDLPADVWSRLRSERDHELRAALICLLTAGLAAQGTATVIGEVTGGWFWLPPWSLWQHWATQGLTNAAREIALKGRSLDKFP
jgi:hypothetical protein